ncbi:MAG: hypothetical protein LBD04_10120 [Synergistaceae bacterium]|jgi:peptide methionine sulfoxide reductase MsrB|nr:hypothetical protein [Synergistaceae bacterium]
MSTGWPSFLSALEADAKARVVQKKGALVRIELIQRLVFDKSPLDTD